MKKVYLSWSSGKDSAWTLHRLRQDPRYEVQGLFTTVNERFSRVAMHAVRQDLLRSQAASASLELHEIGLPWPCSNQVYEAAMAHFLETAADRNIDCVAFGDLFLEDVRAYREKTLDGTGIEPLFPLWGMDTHELARRMVAEGLRATITCVDPKQMPADFAGRTFDSVFIDALPDHVDPCGENGEFHSFAWSGPMFGKEIPFDKGETVERDGFVFTDLLPR